MTDSVQFSGQLSPEQMAQAAEQGFKSIINNRPDMEGGPVQPTSAEIQAAAIAAGLAYAYQPVVSGQITEQDVRAFAEHINHLPKPVLVFCRSGQRSSNLFQLAKQYDLIDD
jgi:uncharacterized protein (TIGR01244 family)